MKAVIYSKEKEFVVVGERGIPQPNSGEVIVRLKAAALNHRELKFINSFNKQKHPKNHEYIFGSDGAGVIVSAGESTSPWKINDEVIIDSTVTCGVCNGCKNHEICEQLTLIGTNEYDGTLAEYIKVPVTNLQKKPAELTFAEAAALPLALGTAWRCLVTRAKIQRGETVLIHGIGGGVALYTLQLAVHLGANVIVTSSSEDKLRAAQEIGASKTINYQTENVIEEVLSYTNNKGVNIIIDGIGASTFKINIGAAAKNARIVLFGFSNSNVPQLEVHDLNQIYEKELNFLEGSVHINKEEFESAMAFWHEHHLHPYVSHTFMLEEIEAAYETLKNGKQFGKIVVTI